MSVRLDDAIRKENVSHSKDKQHQVRQENVKMFTLIND